ncbi:SPOR domain-containing protein [Maricaulaceae bacterium MS644]
MSDDDRRLGAYAPPPDDYETFDARDAEQDRRGWLFLAAAAVVFALFVAVVYNTFQLGVRERSDSPVITADAEPYRVAPQGDETDEPDLGVHGLRSGERSADGGEAAAPRAVSEEPVSLPEARIETADADEMTGDADGDPSEEGGAEPAPSGRSEQAPEPAPEPAPNSSQPARDPSIEDVIAERERAQSEARAEAAPAATPRPAPAEPQPGAAQPYLAQIAAFRSEEDAQSDWRRFARSFPDLASGRNADIQRADLGERGIYYRLRVNGFATRDAANAYCQTLQARGQACMVARR